MATECNAKINKKNDIAGKNYRHRTMKKKHQSPKNTQYRKKCVSLQSLSTVKKAVSKKSIAIRSLLPNFAKVLMGG